ncbi:MAG: DNA polymerase III subunit delta [Rhizobiaceae bacterium]|nr:DNA polymerase III subunit delta [Rhizobiaceae bacterium]
MAQLKAHEVDRFISRPTKDAPILLIYGPDEGLVSERADILAKASGVDLKDPFSLIRLNSDDVAADKSKLADEAHTISMFGGERLIRVSGSTRRDMTKAVAMVLDTPPQDCTIIIEAGDLKRTSGLRKQVEKSKNGLALPCYQDNDAALNGLIDVEITQAGFKIDQETKNFLRSQLGANRRASRNELQKLALHAHGQSEITLDEVKAIVGDTSELILDEVIDAASTGNLKSLEECLEQARESGSAPDMIILSALRHFQMLHAAKCQMETRRQNPQSLFKSLRPPIHFSRERAVVGALNIWNSDALFRTLTRLEKASFDCRSNTALAQTLASTTLLAISLEARALAR